jgi:putative YpdA family bacillithiol system oxidoreductase
MNSPTFFSVVSYTIFTAVLVVPVVSHLRRTRRKESLALEAAERGKLRSDGPKAQHPHIDVSHCIGCGACVDVCPEGDVLAVLAGKAAIVNGHKCIGHGLCADACPVGAIEIVMADPSVSADMPRLSAEHETNVPNLFIVGELGGLALIKNAVNQGRDCVDILTGRLAEHRRAAAAGVYDVCIVGAGPGGISASLRAVENRLSYLTLERGELGGTVAQYPRQKLVMTSPVEFPLHGKFKKLEISKEQLVEFWRAAVKKANLRVNTGESVEDIRRAPDGTFTISSTRAQYQARAVILALGRRGTPRKLGVPGEDRSKVMYSLIEAEAYTNARILIVGGGDSAVEAALGLAYQKGNQVTLSYRKPEFSRIKERNSQRIGEAMRSRRVRVLFNSQPVEIRERSVVLDIQGKAEELPNDWVWVFAGGEPPNAFLEKIGVALGERNFTQEVAEEAVAMAATGYIPTP